MAFLNTSKHKRNFVDFDSLLIFIVFSKISWKVWTLHNLWICTGICCSDWIRFFPTRTLTQLFLESTALAWRRSQLIWMKSRPVETKRSEKLRRLSKYSPKSERKKYLVCALTSKQKLSKCFCSFFWKIHMRTKQFCFWIFPIFFSSAVFISRPRIEKSQF